MTRDECVIVLGRLAAAFPNVTVDDALALAWAEELAGIPYEEGTEVAKTLVRTEQWFPPIARFLETWHVGRKTHRFRNPYAILSADHLYPKLPPEQAAERFGTVKVELRQHPTVQLPPLPGKEARPVGPPPPPCEEHDHAWCLASDQERRQLDPDRWQREREDSQRRWHSYSSGRTA